MLKKIIKSIYQKRGQMVSNKIIKIAIVIILLIVMLLLYKAWTPNPSRVAGCFTEAVKIGPFA